MIWFDLIYKKRGQAEVIEGEEDEEDYADEQKGRGGGSLELAKLNWCGKDVSAEDKVSKKG